VTVKVEETKDEKYVNIHAMTTSIALRATFSTLMLSITDVDATSSEMRWHFTNRTKAKGDHTVIRLKENVGPSTANPDVEEDVRQVANRTENCLSCDFAIKCLDDNIVALSCRVFFEAI
jgi:hypothetical protein